MKQFIKTIGFIIVMGTLIVFSKPIQKSIVKHYNHYVEQMASRSMSSTNLNGF